MIFIRSQSTVEMGHSVVNCLSKDTRRVSEVSPKTFRRQYTSRVSNSYRPIRNVTSMRKCGLSVAVNDNRDAKEDGLEKIELYFTFEFRNYPEAFSKPSGLRP